jgi:hypothetical protein
MGGERMKRLVGRVGELNGFPGAEREVVVFAGESDVTLFMRETYWDTEGAYLGGQTLEVRLSPEQAKALSVWLQNAAVEATKLEETHATA